MAFNLLALTPEEAIASLFVGYFDRAPTPGGLEYWAGRLTDEEDPMTLAEIAASFAVQPESQGLYPQLGGDGGSSLSTNIAFVKNVFNNLFGRDPNNLGPDNYWVNKLENGADVGQLIVDIMSGAQGADKELLQNKIEVGLDWAETAEANGVASGDNPMTTKDDDGNLVILDQSAYDFARSVLKGVNTDVDSVADAKDVINGYFSQYQDNTVFTLTEAEQTTITTIRAEYSEPVLVTMWGFNPHGHGETGVDNLDGNNAGSDAFDDEDSNLQGNDNNLTNEGPLDGGVPLSHLIAYIESLAGLDFVELGLIDPDTADTTDFLTSLTNLSISSSEDSTNNAIATIELTNEAGEVAQAEVELGDYYVNLLNDLLLDNEGNSRLYQQELYIVYDENGDMVTEFLNGVEVPVYSTSPTELVPASVNSVTDIVPIILTPTVNNGGTLEQGYTSDANDLIQAGRLELLHQARIDGGEGYNTLEIDAKGHYAQPLSLLNVQAISIQNLPNVYTDGTASGDSTYPDLATGETLALLNSVIDLSRATDLDILTITEGDFVGVNGQELPGDLTVTGVRDNATLKLEGDFARITDESGGGTTTTVRYSEGMTDGDGLNLILALGDTDGATFNILGNSATVNIESTGGGNAIDANFGKSSLLTMNISGDAFLEISSDLAPQFQANTPATIDASANTAGVDLQIGDESGDGAFTDEVHITGSSASDHFDVVTLRSADIAAGEGDNELNVSADEDITITAGEGDNQIITSTSSLGSGVDNEIVTTITVGGGDNDISVNNTEIFALTAGDGDNRISANADTSFGGFDYTAGTEDDVSTVVLGDGQNEVDVFGWDLDIQAGEGANEINATAGSDVKITAGDGGNTILAKAPGEIDVATGAGNDTVTVVGASDDFVSEGAVLKVDLGGGSSNTLVLGADSLTLETPGPVFANDAIVAKAGSSISGENITLVVENASDLRAAELQGITNVVLNYDISDSYNEAPEGYTLQPALTLTDTQFAAIGAENFDVLGAEFSQYSQIKIIVTESGSLADLGVADLPSGVDVILEIQDGVQFEIDAELLHTKVAPQGVILADDNNTDELSGSVYITNAGLDFDPFNTGDFVRTDIDGQLYYGGSLSYEDFSSSLDANVSRGEWGSNVLIDRILGDGGYDRPADAQSYSRLTIDTDTIADGEIGPIETIETFLRIIGDSDVTFVPQEAGIDEWGRPIEGGSAINLGVDSGATDENNPFLVDFSSVTGSVENLTLGNFENAAGIYGNGTAQSPVRVNVELGGNLGDADEGLVSSGVQTYVVLDLNDEDRQFWTCETTRDLEVLGLQGNYGDAITFGNTEHGVEFLLEVAYSKADGYSVGELNGVYARPGADAVVNIVGIDAMPDGEVQMVDGINLTNAETVTVNVTGGDTVIENLTDTAPGELESVTLTADADVSITADMGAEITSIDAAGVAGDLELSTLADGDFAFVGSAGTTTLTLKGVLDTDDDVSFASAGELDLILNAGGTFDLTEVDVSDISSIDVTSGDTVTLTIAQAYAIGADNISGEGTLALTELDETPFSLGDFDVNVVVNTVAVVEQAEVTLDPTTDLTGVDTLQVYEGTTLNMTAAQYQQLSGSGTIVVLDGADDGIGVDPSTVTINITDLTQADLDPDALDTSNVDIGIVLNILTAEDITLVSDTVLTGVDSITMADDTVLSVEDIEDLDGQNVSGVNAVINVLDETLDSATIDASGLDVSEIRLTNTLVSSAQGSVNVDAVLEGLPFSVEKVIYNGEGLVIEGDQTVTIEAQTTVSGSLAFNILLPNAEVQNFTLNLEGGAHLLGDLDLSSAAKEDDLGRPLLNTHLQTVVINSTGTEANLLTGDTANVMGTLFGNGTPEENNLLDVTINADQELEMEGIIFSSVVDDDIWTINDDEEASASVVINGTADVVLGDLNTQDDDVDALTVNNAGTGMVMARVDAANVDADDALAFTGGNIALTVAGTLDLSDDDLSGLSTLTVEEEADVTLSFGQVTALGEANIISGDTEDDVDEVLTINAYDGSAFDFGTLTDEFVVNLVMADGDITLDPSVDLTGVDSITVPEGGTLVLTADQFQQLDGDGVIVGVDADGNPSTDFTVSVTNLGQANVDLDADDPANGTAEAGDGFKLAGVTADTIMVEIDEDTNFDANTDLNGASVEIQDFHLGLATNAQADELVVNGGAASTVSLLFVVTSIDADGYTVNTLRVFDTAVSGRDVEQVIDNLSNDVTLNIFETTLEVGFVSNINRTVIIEPGTQIGTEGGQEGLFFNSQDSDEREMRTLDITFQGDATDRTELEDQDGNIEGAIIYGDLVITRDAGHTDEEDLFGTLTLRSEGPGESNAITGDITSQSGGGLVGDIDNNLLEVEIIADSAFDVGGSIIFNSEVAAQDEATLTVSGAAPITVSNVDTTASTETIDTVNIVNDGADLTFTGASASGTFGNGTESLAMSGSGSITFGTAEDVEDFADGIDGGGALSSIDASGFAGTLSIETVTNVDVNLFSFTAGTGETSVNFRNITINDDGDVATPSGWNLDFSGAAAGSEVHISGANTFTDGSLNIDLGANTTLYIDADTDWSDLDLSIIQGQPIVLADDVTLTLTAAQASGLNIIAGADTGAPGYSGQVVIEDLGNYPDTNENGDNDDTAELIDYDFSGIQVPASATLFDDDVTLSTGTDLGTVVINLTDLADAAGDPSELVGQTIRFSTEEQAARTINVGAVDGENSTNVVWLFDSITAPVNTDGYDADIGRVWFREALVDGQNVENLFTSLPTQILRVDFATLQELEELLLNSPVDRIIELASFTSLPGGLTFSDQDQLESVETLTIEMGGEVTLGDLLIDNVIDNTGTYQGGTPTFDMLTINSTLADDTGDLLAREDFDEDVNVKPVSGNTFGDIGVGSENNIDLTVVNLDTGVDEGTNDLTADSGTNVLTGTELTGGTITYDTEGTGETAFLNVGGENDITLKGIDVTDTGFNTFTLNLAGTVVSTSGPVGSLSAAFSPSSTLVVTGGSPALEFGSNLEEFNLLQGEGQYLEPTTVYFGYKDLNEDGMIDLETELHLDGNGVAYAGVYGEELSFINLDDGPHDVHLGVLADIDGTDDAGNIAFTLNGVDGGAPERTTAILGEGNVNDVVVAPELESGSTWQFNDACITLTDTAILNAGAILDFNNSKLLIEGDVDLTEVDLNLDGTSTLEVLADSTLILTVEQAIELFTNGTNVVGEGTVKVVGNADDASDFSSILKTGTVDFSDIVLTDEDETAAPGDEVFNAEDLSAVDGDGNQIDQTIIGTPFDDTIIYVGTENVEIIAGDDTGATDNVGTGGSGDGAATYNVTLGRDVVTNIEDDNASGDNGQAPDVFIVAGGAEFDGTLAENESSFTASAESVIQGDATLRAYPSGSGGETTIDLSAIDASGGSTTGMTIVGTPDSEFGDYSADTIKGTQLDDIIIDGLAGNSWNGDVSGSEADVFEGNGGNDTFVFNFSQTEPAEFGEPSEVSGAVDLEEINVASGAGSSGDLSTHSITIEYTLNETATSIAVNDSTVTGGVDFTSDQSIANGIAQVLNGIAGVSASVVESGDGSWDVLIEGDNGNSIEITDVDPNISASGDGLSAGEFFEGEPSSSGAGTDEAQVTEILLSGDVEEDEVYTLQVRKKDGSILKATYTADANDTLEDVAFGLMSNASGGGGAGKGINDFSGGEVTGAVASGSSGDFVITLTDTNADDGGFEVEIASGNPGIQGASASSILSDIASGDVSTSTLDNVFADQILDFMVAEDTLNFGLAEADNGDNFDDANYVSDFGAAFAEARTAFENDADLVYYVTGYNDDASGDADGIEGDVGLVFVDANGDQSPDAVVALIGVAEGDFDDGNITGIV